MIAGEMLHSNGKVSHQVEYQTMGDGGFEEKDVLQYRKEFRPTSRLNKVEW
jgi:hypothetical protein